MYIRRFISFRYNGYIYKIENVHFNETITTDYNALNNKPIDNYVLQNNLDCGAHNLTNINNIYTKTEVDDKVQWYNSGQVIGTWDDINNMVISACRGNKLHTFQTNYTKLKPLTVLTVASTVVRLQGFALAVGANGSNEVYMGTIDAQGTQEVKTISWLKLQTAQVSQTITHEAPYVGDADEYTIGDPHTHTHTHYACLRCALRAPLRLRWSSWLVCSTGCDGGKKFTQAELG